MCTRLPGMVIILIISGFGLVSYPQMLYYRSRLDKYMEDIKES